MEMFLKGVNVTVEHTVWLGTYLYATTNAKGKYSIAIPNDPAGDWIATARCNRHNDKGAAVKQTVVFGKYGDLGDTEYNIEFWVSE
jgi:hypothetical protein